MIAKGINGQLEVLDDKIIIRRKGLFAFAAHGFKGDKTIPIRHITAIQLKIPGILTKGYIQFTIAGGIESRAGIRDATTDENSILLT